MPHCAAWGCSNQTKYNTNVSYHRLPSDKNLADVWKEKINRKKLPANVFLCSRHFEKKCFDPSYELKIRLMKNEEAQKFKRKLLPGAIPTIFPHDGPQMKKKPQSDEESSSRQQVLRDLLRDSSSEDDTQLIRISKANFQYDVQCENIDSKLENILVSKLAVPLSIETSLSSTCDNVSLVSMWNEDSLQISNNDIEIFNIEQSVKSVACQTDPVKISPIKYTKHAQTMTTRRNRKDISVSANIEKQILVSNYIQQFPSPSKKCRKFKRSPIRRRKRKVPPVVTSKQIDKADSDSDSSCSTSSSSCSSSCFCSSSSSSSSWNSSSSLTGILPLGLQSENEYFTMDDELSQDKGLSQEKDEGVVKEMADDSHQDCSGLSNMDSSGTCSDTCSNYIPETESEDEEESDFNFREGTFQNKARYKPNLERTFFVYESCLMQLLKFCPNCGGHVDQSEIAEMKNTGSQLILKFTCFNNCEVTWMSQPDVTSLRGIGNLSLSSAIVFVGMNFSKFNRLAWLLNLKFFSEREHYNLKRDVVIPVIKHKWRMEQRRIVKELQVRDEVVLIGDGRCDSMGHCAKYCTYTVMETERGDVVETIVVPVTDVKNSNAMEPTGFRKAISKIKSKGVAISTIATDRHPVISSMMRVDPELKDINHQYDPWHVIKGIVKKLNQFSKKRKENHCLVEWIPSIVNHFWWALLTCEGNPVILFEKFSSIQYHMVDRHSWPGYVHFKECAHGPIEEDEDREKKWLQEDSGVHQYLVSLFRDKKLRKDMCHMTDRILTTNVEVFNNVLTKYCPKQYHFQLEHMEASAYLAALENNMNTWRDHAKDAEENCKYAIAWRKPLKKYVAKKVKETKQYDYLKIMMNSCLKQVTEHGQKKRVSRRSIMAPAREQSKEDLILKTQNCARY